MGLIATVIERCEGPSEPGPGHPPVETVRVLATLRRFRREGTPWRSVRATPAQASGSTLRRRLAAWAAINLLQRGHALLVAMRRGHPDLILGSCSAHAKRGGDRTGPNPTDRGKRGTRHHVAVDGGGVPDELGREAGADTFRRALDRAQHRADVPDQLVLVAGLRPLGAASASAHR